MTMLSAGDTKAPQPPPAEHNDATTNEAMLRQINLLIGACRLDVAFILQAFAARTGGAVLDQREPGVRHPDRNEDVHRRMQHEVEAVHCGRADAQDVLGARGEVRNLHVGCDEVQDLHSQREESA